MSYKLCTVFTLFLFFLLSAQSVSAVTTPSYPSCVNPQGSIKANYETGKHGIVGSSNEYSGKDTVYSLENGNTLQCFCASNGDGIATNWLKATGYTQEEINILKNSGWTFIPDGALWGLDHTSYLAQNNTFSCLGTTNSGNGSSNSSSTASNPSQAVLGAATVLAGTGNLKAILYIFSLSIGTLLTALLLKRWSK